MKKLSENWSVLTHLVLWYQRTGEGFEMIKEKVMLITYSFPLYWKRGSEELASEFCLLFVPKIHTMVMKFSYQGRPFEVYLHKAMKNQMHDFNKKQYKEAERHNTVLHYNAYHTRQTGVWDDAVQSEEPEYQVNLPKRISPRRFLILTLVMAFKVTPEWYEVIAEHTGCTVQQISQIFSEVLEAEHKRSIRYSNVQRLRDKYFGNMITYQYRIYDSCDEEEKKHLSLLNDKNTVILKRIRMQLESSMLRVPHQTVADVLGIPKGTVDSSMYYMKRIHRPED